MIQQMVVVRQTELLSSINPKANSSATTRLGESSTLTNLHLLAKYSFILAKGRSDLINTSLNCLVCNGMINLSLKRVVCCSENSSNVSGKHYTADH